MGHLIGIRRVNVASELYVRALTSIYKHGMLVYDPDYALSQDVEAYEKIRRDAIVAHAIEHRKHLVAGRQWHCAPASEDPQDKLAAQAIEDLLKKIERFSSARFNLAEAVIRGSAIAFIHGERRPCNVAGLGPRTWWVPTRLQDIDKRRYRQGIDGETKAVRWELWSIDRERWEPVIEPRWFARHVYEDTESSLGYGRGLLEAIYFYAWLKTQVLEHGAQGVERWAQGVIKAAIDGLRAGSTGRANDDLVDEWLDVLEKLRSRHALVHDKNDEFDVISGGGEGWQIVKEMLLYLDNGLRTLILGSNLPTSATEGGSFALAEIQENSTEALVQYDRSLLDETFTRDLVGLVWDLNRGELAAIGLGEAQKPRYETVQEKREDPEKAAQVVTSLLDRGVALKADEVYEKTGFTPPGPGDEIIEGRPAPDPFGGLLGAPPPPGAAPPASEPEAALAASARGRAIEAKIDEMISRRLARERKATHPGFRLKGPAR